jgi:hypothetical protein
MRSAEATDPTLFVSQVNFDVDINLSSTIEYKTHKLHFTTIEYFMAEISIRKPA